MSRSDCPPVDELTTALVTVVRSHQTWTPGDDEDRQLRMLCHRAARRLVRSGSCDADAIAGAADLVGDAIVDRKRRDEARHYLEQARASGDYDPAIVNVVRRMLDDTRLDLVIDDPSEWVTTWLRIEHQRYEIPDRIIDAHLRAQFVLARDAVYHDPEIQALISRESGYRVDPDDVRQGAVDRLFRRFLKADRTVALNVMEPGKERAYAFRVVRNQIIDLVGRHPELPADLSDESTVLGPEPMDAVDDLAVNRADFESLLATVVRRSYAAPGIVGPLYGEQFLGSSNANARRSVARRFAIAALFTTWQRRADHLIAPDMIDAMREEPERDSGAWLMPSANRALGCLIPGWVTAYGNRPPRDGGITLGPRGVKESSNYSLLLRDCQGQTDKRRVPDGHGEHSVRQFGVSGLLRLVYAESVTAWIGERA